MMGAIVMQPELSRNPFRGIGNGAPLHSWMGSDMMMGSDVMMGAEMMNEASGMMASPCRKGWAAKGWMGASMMMREHAVPHTSGSSSLKSSSNLQNPHSSSPPHSRGVQMT